MHKMSQSYNPNFAVTKLVWANSRSLAATNEITIVFSSSGYLDVSVPRVNLLKRILVLQTSGLPHSEICGSTCMCQSPQLIAAYHVLHRLWEPRHSPYALTLLIVLFCSLMSLIQYYSWWLIGNRWWNKSQQQTTKNQQLTLIIAFLVFLFPICQWTFLASSLY